MSGKTEQKKEDYKLSFNTQYIATNNEDILKLNVSISDDLKDFLKSTTINELTSANLNQFNENGVSIPLKRYKVKRLFYSGLCSYADLLFLKDLLDTNEATLNLSDISTINNIKTNTTTNLKRLVDIFIQLNNLSKEQTIKIEVEGEGSLKKLPSPHFIINGKEKDVSNETLSQENNSTNIMGGINEGRLLSLSELYPDPLYSAHPENEERNDMEENEFNEPYSTYPTPALYTEDSFTPENFRRLINETRIRNGLEPLSNENEGEQI